MNHCAEIGSCHEHVLQTINGVASGSFFAPDHPYPSYLTIRLTATDAGGLTHTDTVDLQPRTTVITLDSTPVAVTLQAGVEGLSSHTTPATITAIEGGSLTLNAPSPWWRRVRSIASCPGATVSPNLTQSSSRWPISPSSPPTRPVLVVAAAAEVAAEAAEAEAAVVPHRAPAPVLTFDDVPATHPFAADIAWLAQQGITQGCDDALFCPEDAVTRGQMASFLVRALGLPPATSDQFIDISGSIHEADIVSLVAAGITFGCCR